MCYFYTNENSKERMYLIFYASYPRNFRELTFVTLLNSTKNTLYDNNMVNLKCIYNCIKKQKKSDNS